MKYNILILLLIFSTFSLAAQKGNTYFTQEKWLERAKAFEVSSDNHNAMIALYYAYTENPGTPAGKAALKKSDSLKTVFRKRLMTDLQGTWELKLHGTSWGYTSTDTDTIKRFVTISGNTATFYETNSKTGNKNIVQEETLHFVDLNSEYYRMLEFIYNDNRVWSYTVKDNVLNIVETGKAEGQFISTIVCGNSEYSYKRT